MTFTIQIRASVLLALITLIVALVFAAPKAQPRPTAKPAAKREERAPWDEGRKPTGPNPFKTQPQARPEFTRTGRSREEMDQEIREKMQPHREKIIEMSEARK